MEPAVRPPPQRLSRNFLAPGLARG